LHLRRWSGKRLLALAVLAWASCGGSSGGNSGNTGGSGGASPGDGAAGNAPPAGNAATDASATGSTGGSTGGGYGGSPGGYGGSGGGTPSPCMDPAYPVSCPANNGVPAICWSAGTDCSTLTKCGDQFRSCLSASTHFDCTQMTCVPNAGVDAGPECGDPSYPVPCPERGDVQKLCWSNGTICSTISRCGNDFKSCKAAGFHFDCTQQRCVADGAMADASADAHD